MNLPFFSSTQASWFATVYIVPMGLKMGNPKFWPLLWAYGMPRRSLMDVVFFDVFYQKKLGLMFKNIILEVIYITFSFELMSLSHGDFERCFSFFHKTKHILPQLTCILCFAAVFFTELIWSSFACNKKNDAFCGMCTGTRGLDRHVPILFDLRSSGLEVRSVFFDGKN